MSRQKVKIITVGNSGVGKTSIILRADGQEFSANVVASLGASYCSASSKHDGKEIILQIWDTAGQERFRSMIPLYARNARACLLVYDITLRQTFHDIPIWLKEVEKSADLDLIMVVANKTDLEELRVVSKEEGIALAEKIGATYFETSAKNGTGITATVAKLGELIAEKLSKEEPQGLQAMGIAEDDKELSSPKKSRCCGFY